MREPVRRENEDTEDVVFLLRRAASLRRLAHCFVYPAPGHRQVLLDLLEQADPRDRQSALAESWQVALDESLGAEYCRLFLGDAPCPANETAWGDARRLGGVSAELADLQGFYRAFGFDVAGRGGDMADHLSAELEFLAALLMKAAYAQLRGWTEASEITSGAARSFLEVHLGRWVGAFASRLREVGADSPYRVAADAVEAAVRTEAEHLGSWLPPENSRTPWAARPPGTRHPEPDTIVCQSAMGVAPGTRSPES